MVCVDYVWFHPLASSMNPFETTLTPCRWGTRRLTKKLLLRLVNRDGFGRRVKLRDFESFHAYFRKKNIQLMFHCWFRLVVWDSNRGIPE